MEERNAKLRRTVEDKEDEITKLEQEIARLKARETGIQLLTFYLFLFHTCPEKKQLSCFVSYLSQYPYI